MIGACPSRPAGPCSMLAFWTVQGNLNGEESNMRSWLRIGIVGAGALAVMLGPLWTAPAIGQVAERRKVLVTNLVPRNGANDDFGKDLGKELRSLIDDLATHQAVEEKEIRNTAKKYDLDMDELDCVRSLQLSGQLRANIVFCGEYTEDRQARTFTLNNVQFANARGAPLEVPDKTWHKDDYKVAAQEIAALFDTFIQRLRDAANCEDYYNTQAWESAERNCKRVLDQAPNDAPVRLVLAQVYRQTDRFDEAYAETLKVVELEPLNEDALRLAGWLATTIGLKEEGRAHNEAFLQLNPGNAAIRMQIAYDQAQAGDPHGAMLLVEEGLEIEPDNTDLLLYHGSFAIAAGQADQEGGQPPSAAAGVLYQQGSESYRKAYEVLGADMDSAHLYRMISTLGVLNQLDRAVELAEQVLETHGEETRLWYLKGNLLNRLGRVDEALLALDEAEALDPNYPNLKATQGQWLLAVGRDDEALEELIEAVEKGEQPADVIANMFMARAGNEGIRPKNYEYALTLIDMAKTFESELSARVLGQLEFYEALCIYQIAYVEEQPQNLQSAQLTLPKFREVQRLLALPHVVDWVQGAPERTQTSFRDMRDGVIQFIEIQDLIIQRGR